MNLVGRVLLYVGASVLSVIGVLFIFWPHAMGALVALGMSSPAAATDVRATYGGFELGVALFLGYCASAPGLVRAGLVAAFLGMLGFAVGRGVGMWVDGSVAPIHRSMFIFELTTAGIILLVHRKTAAKLVPAP